MEKEIEASEEGVYHKSVHGGKWFLLGNVLQKILNIVPFLILARILFPQDYGIIAVVFMFTSVLDKFSTPGFGSALLQRKESIDEYIDTVWTYDLIKSIIIAGIIFVFGGLVGAFFHVPSEYVLIIKLSGILTIITAISNPRQLYFFKNLDFKKVFIRDLVGQAVYIIVALVVALFISASAWALFFGYVARYLSGMVVTYVFLPSLPKLSFKFSKLRDLIGYGKWIYGQQILDYLLGFLDNILVGRLLGQRELGLYSRARDLPTTVSWPLLNVMNKIAFPAYSKLQDQKEKIQEGFLKSLDVLLLVAIPFSLLLLVEGGSIVSVLLGANWMSIVLPLKILAVANIFSALVMMQRPIFNAIGKPEINVHINILQLVIFSITIFLGIRWMALPGAAIAVTLGWVILLVYSITRMRPILRIGWDRLLPIAIPSVVATTIIFTLAVLGRIYLHQNFNDIIILVWVAFLGILYLLIAMFVSKKIGNGLWYTIMAILNEIGFFKLLKSSKTTKIDDISSL